MINHGDALADTPLRSSHFTQFDQQLTLGREPVRFGEHGAGEDGAWK